ncbi:MAG TPA: matrixin family metalloprotease [Longimicrobiaceae bacterium]|nr:matrixin family metalloprotease [Longimicrobiaceae bacterium]
MSDTVIKEQELFERLKDELRNKVVEIDGETYYVVEGDLVLDEDQLLQYARQRYTLRLERNLRRTRSELGMTDLASPATAALTGITENGKIVRWKDGIPLTYCVLRNTFNTQEEYDFVRASMKSATMAWEATCGISFTHLTEHDNSSTTNVSAVLFTVRKLDSGGRFIAAAFFPNDPPVRRRVLIDPSFFAPSLGFDRVGVLRHELGHVLGFRHEHIRSGAPPACPKEDTFDTIDLTQYDPNSVMHYFCGSVGTRELAITALDLRGAQRVYGAPRAEFAFVE